jgi:signal transduction histidine kinase
VSTPAPLALGGLLPEVRRLPAKTLSPRDWSLRVKLTVVLLVPGLLAVILGGLRIADQAAQAHELARVARFGAAQGDVETLLHRLQIERLRATAFVAGARRADPKTLDQTFSDVAASAATVGPIVEALYADDPDLIGVNQTTRQGLNRLDALRSLALTSNAPGSAIVSRYTDLINLVTQLDDQLLRGVNTTVTNGLTTALSGLAVARNEASLQQALILVATRSDGPVRSVLDDLNASNARLVSGLADFRAALDVAQRVRYASLVAGRSNADRNALLGVLAAQDGSKPIDPAAVGDFNKTYTAFLADIDGTETEVHEALTTQTSESQNAAMSQAVLNTVLVILALLVGALVVILIARALLRSLRILRMTALDVARRRLPEAIRRVRSGATIGVDVEPVPITTTEEIGEVARAFDAVHREAIRLATEQAELQSSVNRMFINLSRRSKSLVDKQLQLIEDLERDEQNSGQLATLFRLDHLATRMRRNSDNLLVLAGSELPSWSSQPLPVVDTMRAAISEIESYQRIVLVQVPQAVLAGRAANDMQHLLAELLDNATSFSPPDSQVMMSASFAPEGQLVVSVTDRGVGMFEDELRRANAQLSRVKPAEADTGRRMGLQVVGRLAARHDVTVELIADHPGLIAVVTIPPQLVTVEVPQQGRFLSPRPRPKPTSVPAPAAPPSGLPVRTPARPMAQDAGVSRPGLFIPSDLPENRSVVSSGIPRRQTPFPAAEDAAATDRGPIYRLTDPASGQSRHYRPVRINVSPDRNRSAQSEDGSGPAATSDKS